MPLLKKVIQISDPASDEFKLAKIVVEKRPLTVSTSNVEVADKIREIGGYETAAEFDLALARQAQNTDEAARLVKSAIASFQAGGNKTAITALINDELLKRISPSARESLASSARLAASKTDEKLTSAATVESAPSIGKDLVTTAGVSADNKTVVVKPDASTKTVKYAVTPATTITDETGSRLAVNRVPANVPATVYYTKQDDRLIVRELKVHSRVAKPGPMATASPR
jgi:hypothetical protein